MRKGLATLVCLTLVAVVWAWAATAYSTYWVETKTTTLGGSVKVANNTALSGVGAIRFTSFTTAAVVPVTVTPDAGYKISTVTVDNVAQTVPVSGAYTYNGLQTPDHTVKIFAGFVGSNAATSAAKTWQLQIQNGSAGGTISAAGHSIATYGMKMYNYSDTTAIPVTVAPATGFYVSSLYVNGVLQSGFATTGGTYTVDPSVTGKVFNVTANYKKQINVVTTNTSSPLVANGILPVNPKVAYGTDVKLIVAPMAPYNMVTGITVTGTTHGAISMVDSQGNTAAPFKGSVVVTIANVTGPLNLSYAAGTDNTGQMQGCTNTCHLSASASVQRTATQWNLSNHKRNAVDCVSCHETMPGTWTSTTVDKKTMAIGSAVVCSKCHADANVEGFLTSPHWTNLRNNGDSAVAGDQLATCATQKCHFNSTNQPGCATCHSGQLAAAGTFNRYSSDIAHNPATPTAANTCMICHTGSHHGSPTESFKKSAHYLDPYFEMKVTCVDCHDSHSTKAEFPAYDATTHAKTAAGSCDKCHVGQYSIFNADNSMKAPHSMNKLATNTSTASSQAAYKGTTQFNVGSTTIGWYSGTRVVYVNVSSSYVTPNNSCTDCHGHNNQINGEYAETMHADPYGRWKSASYFKYRGFSSASVNPSNSASDGCVRCHTTTGFVNFINSNFQDLRAWGFQNTADTTGEVITCRACHVTTKGAISGEAEVALPEGNINGWNPASIRAYNKPFTAYYNYSSKLSGKIIKSATYRDFKNSNVCISCHAGRNGATNGAVFATLGTFAQYTTLTLTGGSALGAPHGVYQAAILDGKMGYKFGNKYSTYTSAANGHAAIGVTYAGTGTSGPCVTCHMDNNTETGSNGSASYRKHNFEVAKADGTLPTVCATCHSAGFNAAAVDEAKNRFVGAVYTLAQYMASSNNKYGTPIIVFTYSNGSYGISPANSKRLIANTAFTGKSADFADLAGAYYNIKFLWNVAYSTSDEGAFAHNPQYLKQLVNDTAAFLNNGNAAAALAGVAPVAASTTAPINPGVTADQVKAAGEYVVNINNHYAAGTYKVQYMVGSAACTTCHNPSESTLQAAAREAWAESAHGETTGAAWMPGSGHLWRNAGATTDFSQVIPKNDCQRCHTADGFAQFADSKFTNITPVDTAANAVVNSPLNCNTCHTNNSFDRRSVVSLAAAAYGNGKTYASYPAPDSTVGVGVATFYNISTVDKVTGLTVKARTAVKFPDVGESNMCNSCHSGRLGGATLVQAVNNGLSLSNSGFQNSHYLAASGLMYAKVGFTAFTSASATIGSSTYGKTLTSSLDMNGGVSSTHRNLGTPAIVGDHSIVAGTLDENGPCITCHMRAKLSGAQANRPDAGHKLEINADAYNQVCINCHTSEGSATGPVALDSTNFLQKFVEPNQNAFQVSLNLAIKLLKDNYNISYNSAAYPYFYDESLPLDSKGNKQSVTDWTRGGTLSNASALKLEGACLNINLLSREPAAFVHARSYVRRLVYDTIDFLDNGTIDLSVATTASTVDPTNFGAGATAYTDGTLGTFATGTTEGMLYLKAWNRSAVVGNGTAQAPQYPAGSWAAVERP
ncbi:hypothetical protein L4X63_14295 [Geomonas sp. Red32]|uniref:multiheme c-type cytochrome n=1 Tax=Geomonas sp. Red32 TaxID=2912856 RepID=UPI00202CF6ED|nr:multiheme c-type cytochrome [Geomonas sp. Red32]MCM0082761.1 hypothetical protein [Geomonas sp. Red32]